MTDISKKVSRPQIREIFLRNGARIEPDRDDMPDRVYESVFELLEMAAPAVQGEPVAITDADILAIAGRVESCPVSPWWLKDDVAIGDVRAAVLRFARALLVAAPQPAVQQPCPEGVREGAPYDDPAFEELCREYEIWGTAAAAQCAVFWEAGKRVAEQRAAPDVAGLVEALEAVVFYHEEVEDNDGNLMMHYSKMLRMVREALAAHRKQEPGHD